MKETVKMDRLAKCRLCGKHAVVRSERGGLASDDISYTQYKIGCITQKCSHYVGKSPVFFDPDKAEMHWATITAIENNLFKEKPTNHKDWSSFEKTLEGEDRITVNIKGKTYEIIAVGQGYIIVRDPEVRRIPAGAM